MPCRCRVPGAGARAGDRCRCRCRCRANVQVGQDERVPDGSAEQVTAPGAPSPWVVRFAPLIPAAGPVLDVACGRGRHTRFLLHLGRDVVAVDRDLAGIADLRDDPRLEAVEVDLEDGRPFPLAGRHFAAVVVTNYLHRPILDDLVAAVGPGGLLLYETFASGNEAVGRPSNPAYLLAARRAAPASCATASGSWPSRTWSVEQPRPAVVQRIAAVRVVSRLTRRRDTRSRRAAPGTRHPGGQPMHGTPPRWRRARPGRPDPAPAAGGPRPRT